MMTTSKKKTKATEKGGKLSAKGGVKKSASKKVSAGGQELSLKITPQGPSPELFATVSRELLQHASLRSLTAKTRSRLLALELVEEEPKTKPLGLRLSQIVSGLLSTTTPTTAQSLLRGASAIVGSSSYL